MIDMGARVRPYSLLSLSVPLSFTSLRGHDLMSEDSFFPPSTLFDGLFCSVRRSEDLAVSAAVCTIITKTLHQ